MDWSEHLISIRKALATAEAAAALRKWEIAGAEADRAAEWCGELSRELWRQWEKQKDTTGSLL